MKSRRQTKAFVLGKNKGKEKIVAHNSLSFFDYHPYFFKEPAEKLVPGFHDPSNLGYTEVLNVSPFIQDFYDKGFPSRIEGIPVSDRIFRGQPERMDDIFRQLGDIYQELEAFVQSKDPLYYKSAVFSLKEIRSMVYIPGKNPTYHHGMLSSVADRGFETVKDSQLISFIQDQLSKSSTKKRPSVSVKRHTNTGGLLPSSGANLYLNALCLAIQCNIGLDADVKRLTKFENLLKDLQLQEGYTPTGFLRLFGYRFQNSASAVPTVELSNSGYNVTGNRLGEQKVRVINFGGKETEIAAKSWVNPQLHRLKNTPFVSTDPEKTRKEQKKVLAHTSAVDVVSLDFAAFDSTVGSSTLDIVQEIHKPWMDERLKELWDFEASMDALSAPLHKNGRSVYIDKNIKSKLENGRWDTSLTGITTGVYLGLLSIKTIQYKGDHSSFVAGMNKEWHVADYGDDLQVTTSATIEQIDEFLSTMGFNVEAEPTTSHLKVIIDHDRNLVHNSFFSMFKNLICPERPKTDKMTFALGIQARIESSMNDPLVKLPSVKKLLQTVLDYQGDFSSIDEIQNYLRSSEFHDDMKEYVKASITRAHEMTDILAAATKGSFLYEDLPNELSSVLGLTEFELLNRTQDIREIKRLSEDDLVELFIKVAKFIYFDKPEYKIDPEQLLDQYFNYNKENHLFSGNGSNH